MRRFLSSSLWLRSCKLVDPSRKSTGSFVVIRRGAMRCESMPGTPCNMEASGGNGAAACGITYRA